MKMRTNNLFNKLASSFLSAYLILSPLNSFQKNNENNLEKKFTTEKTKYINQNPQEVATYNKTVNKKEEFVENARKHIGTSYHWGGRLTKKNPGLDCLGLIFLPYSKTHGTNWNDISVYPSKIVANEQLGKPVKGLDGVLKEDLDISKLEKGDIIYLLSNAPINDHPLAEINGIKYWPWHTGIYSDKKKNLFLEASPGKEVIEHSFEEVLMDESNKAFFVTRTN